MTDASVTWSANWILKKLAEADQQPFLSRLQPAPLRFNESLFEVGAPLSHVYFPIRGALSAMKMMGDGDGIEVASIGREGFYGHPTYREAAHSPYRVLVQSQGEAYRIEAAAFHDELSGNEKLRRLVDSFQAVFLAAVSQAASCNGLHTVMQRCCRWLLASSDRLESDELPHTHEFLSLMLGVRRPSVTDVLQPLQQKEIIRHSRGKITIVDHRALEERACECYRALKESRRRIVAPFESAGHD